LSLMNKSNDNLQDHSNTPPATDSFADSIKVKTDQPDSPSYTHYALRERKRWWGNTLRLSFAGMLMLVIAGVMFYFVWRGGGSAFSNSPLSNRKRPTLIVEDTPSDSMPPGEPSVEVDFNRVREVISQSVVLIETLDHEESSPLGAGFIIDDSGLIVTNHHVIGSATAAQVRFRDGATVPIEGYVGIATEQDLAILKIETDRKLKPLQFGKAKPAPLDVAYVVGHPQGVAFSIHSGSISRMVRTPELSIDSQRFLDRHLGKTVDLNWIQHTAMISVGNSGGPLLNQEGAVVGVNTWINRQSGFGYALDIRYLRDLLKSPLKEVAPLERYASKETRVAASLQRLSVDRVRRLVDEARSWHWQPQSAGDYAVLQELAWLVSLARLSPEAIPNVETANLETIQQYRALADEIEQDLKLHLGDKKANWNQLTTVTLVNEFAADQIARPMAGIYCFGQVQRTVEGDGGARGVLVRLAGYDRLMFIRLNKDDPDFAPETQCLIVGVNLNGRVVRYGDNPLRLTTAHQIAAALLLTRNEK